jgi:Tol biopolymer transport system component
MADSRHLLMQLNGRDGVGGLAVGDSRTGSVHPLELRNELGGQPSAFPDGRFLVPFSEQDSADIVELPLDGSAPRPLIATKQYEGWPDWSRPGDQLVYTAVRSGLPEILIWSPAADLHRSLVTERSLRGAGMSNPVFSPDGRRVAFGARGTIWVVPAAGGAPVEPLPPDSGAALPTWSPDGQWLAYVANRAGKQFLEKIRLGTDRPIIVHETTNGVRPAWSPDGRWITLAVPGGTAVISPDGQVTKRVHDRVTSWTSTGWSRDGKTLYLAITDGTIDPIPTTLWAIDPDTGRERAIGHYTGIFLGGASTNNLSASPGGKSLTATLVKPHVYIWLVEGLKPPQSFWQRLFSRP